MSVVEFTSSEFTQKPTAEEVLGRAIFVEVEVFPQSEAGPRGEVRPLCRTEYVTSRGAVGLQNR